MSIHSNDGGDVEAASVVRQLEGVLGKYHRNGGAQVIASQNTDVVVVGSCLQRVAKEIACCVDDEDMVFVSSNDNGQCCGAGGRQSTDAVTRSSSIGWVGNGRAQGSGESCVVGAMLSPVGCISKEGASGCGGHGGAWLALNGFNAN